MKKSILVLSAMIMMAITTTVSAQFPTASTNGQASASLFVPLEIYSGIPLNFGTMTVPSVDVDLVLDPASGAVGANSALTHLGLNTKGIFLVKGQANTTYQLTLQSQPVTITSNGESMTIDDFKFYFKNSATTGVSGTIGKFDAGGGEEVFVGATLRIKAGQKQGVYSGLYTLTAAYN